MTLLEVIVVIAVMVFMTGIILPWLARPRYPSAGRTCVNNLKQVGLSFRIFSTDNEEKLPWQVSTNRGGSLEYRNWPTSAFRHFLAVSNELSAPGLLICPQDKRRTAAINWQVGNQNVSYFVGLDAKESATELWLAGDRNLMTNGVPVGSGLLELTTNWTVGWTSQIHNQSGNLLFGDGHVDQLSNGRLRQQLIDSGVATNRLLIP